MFAQWSLLSALDFRQLSDAFKRYGGRGEVFESWQATMGKLPGLDTRAKLTFVNEFFNSRVRQGDDITIWGQSDYWATPMETLASGNGDCEDFTIAKYFSLLHAGVPIEQLRLIYVKAKIGGPYSDITQAHMVLAWYATPDAEPLILDSLITDIRPASRRPDLVPVFSFNSNGIWGSNRNASPYSTSRLSRWQTLLSRARSEGFDQE